MYMLFPVHRKKNRVRYARSVVLRRAARSCIPVHVLVMFLAGIRQKRIYPVDSRQAMERLYVVFGVQSTMAFLLQSSHSKIRSWMNATSPGHVAERRVPIVQLTQRHPNRRQSLRSSLISVDATQTCQTSHGMSSFSTLDTNADEEKCRVQRNESASRVALSVSR